MSLLEDVFLQDEAGEAQELERIIEGDEYDERPRQSPPDSDDNSEKEDEAEEDKRRVEPTSAKPKRIVKNPRVVLNPARLTGPRGIHIIPEHFKDFRFKGKGHEKEDLDLVLKKLEHWAYRLFPKFEFADCLKKIETLGKKRPVMVHLTKIRSDQFVSEDMDTVVQQESSDDEAPKPVQEEDEFDKLLQQQIDLARATPAPGSTRKPAFSTPMEKSQIMPKATSSPSISDEMRERMLRNRQMAEERRLARLKQNTETNSTNNVSKDTVTIDNELEDTSNTRQGNEDNAISDQNTDVDNVTEVMNNRSHVIDSSDEDDAVVVNESVIVDHDSHRNDKNNVDTQNKNTIAKALNNRSHVIDSSDDDDAVVVNESVIVDHDSHRNDKNDIDNQNTTAKVQNNRSHVIDSSDEDDAVVVNESVIVDNDSHRNDNNDVDNQNKNTIAKAQNNRSHVIDSSDEDDAVVDHGSHRNEKNNVDNQNKATIAKEQKNISHVIDSSDEDDALVINESITIDDDDSRRKVDSDKERNSNKHNQHRNTGSKVKSNASNVIDITDEDNAIVLNEAVNIDVHDSNNKSDNDENHSDNQNIVSEDTVRSERNDVEMTEIDNVDKIGLRHTNDNIEPLDDLEEVSNTENNKNVEEIPTNTMQSNVFESNETKEDDSEVIVAENDSDQQKQKERLGETSIPNVNKDNHNENKQNELDDIMDVDFDDDF